METITGLENGTQFINKLNSNFAEASGGSYGSPKVELIGSYLSTTDGGVVGAYSSYADVKKYLVSPRYINVQGADRTVSVTGVVSGEQYAIFQYEDDYSFIGATYKDYNEDTTLDDDCSYIKVSVKKSNSGTFDNDKRFATLNIQGWNGRESYNVGSEATAQFHTFDVRKPYADRFITANATYTGDTGRLLTRGYIYLPKGYTPTGRPCPVVIHCHGTSGMKFSADALPYNGAYMEFLANCGYAVIGVSTLTELYPSVTYDGDLCHPLGFACWHSLWDYMKKMYNLADEAYVFGYSGGGMYTLMLSEQNTIPIRAAASLAGTIDMFSNMRACINELNQKWIDLLGIDLTITGYGYISTQGSQKPVDSYFKTYVLAHLDEFAGYNPLFYGSDIDRSAFITRFFDINNETSVLAADSTLQGVVDAARVYRKAPIKFWHAVDDTSVPIQMARWYVQMVKRGGGIAILREISEGHGGHYALGYTGDTSGAIPMTDYVTRYGDTINVPIAYAEMVDWFNQW